jgi:hypothetical protein
MPTKAQISAGAASGTIGRRQKARAPRQDSSAYEKARIDEIGARASLYRLRLDKLESELLDARLLRIELPQMFDAIRQIILATRMTDREKNDCLRNLRPVDEILEMVASRQSADELRSNGGNGNGRNGHHSQDEFS